MNNWPEDIALSGQYVSLIPLSMEHLSDLQDAVKDGDLHLLWYTMIPNSDGMAAEIIRRLDLRSRGSMQPFAIIDKSSGHAVGMTTFMNIDATINMLKLGQHGMQSHFKDHL